MKYALGVLLFVLLFVGSTVLSVTLNKYEIITSHAYWELSGAAKCVVYILFYRYYFK